MQIHEQIYNGLKYFIVNANTRFTILEDQSILVRRKAGPAEVGYSVGVNKYSELKPYFTDKEISYLALKFDPIFDSTKTLQKELWF